MCVRKRERVYQRRYTKENAKNGIKIPYSKFQLVTRILNVFIYVCASTKNNLCFYKRDVTRLRSSFRLDFNETCTYIEKISGRNSAKYNRRPRKSVRSGLTLCFFCKTHCMFIHICHVNFFFTNMTYRMFICI